MLVALGLVATACGGDDLAADGFETALGDGAPAGSDDSTGESNDSDEIEILHPDGWPGVVDVPADIYNPFLAGEETPEGFRQLLARDRIPPVYLPTFVAAADAGWPGEELVIGVDLEGEARAYPVGFLTRREIVVDLHRGIPTLVTW